MTLDDFYAECAALLGTRDECEAFTHYKRTRWNNRKPGRGRYPGYGIIRAYGDLVQIHLHSPKDLRTQIIGLEEALAFLRSELSL
jgi:hypothetical protein